MGRSGADQLLFVGRASGRRHSSYGGRTDLFSVGIICGDCGYLRLDTVQSESAISQGISVAVFCGGSDAVSASNYWILSDARRFAIAGLAGVCRVHVVRDRRPEPYSR